MSFLAAQKRTTAVDDDVVGSSSDEQDSSAKHRVTRSRSNADVVDCKGAWAAAIVAQEVMQSSMQSLHDNLDAYECRADGGRWFEVVSMQADGVKKELNAIAQKAEEKQRARGRRTSAWFDKFSPVALEYSRLLDVLMNQCPEYVTAAWGAMKILLLAQVNHAKLKENVESYLIAIGERLGLVNQLVCYSPTDKMVEAVALLYASFSKFLVTALRCYSKCRLSSIVDALRFPWETKFEKLVTLMDLQFRRIQDLAHASHFHATLQHHHLLHSIWDCVKEHRNESRRDRSMKRIMNEKKALIRAQESKELKEEVKRGISELLGQCHSKILVRFDELVTQQNINQGNKDSSFSQDVDTFDFATRMSLEVEEMLKFREY